jgi:hypothetical protein
VLDAFECADRRATFAAIVGSKDKHSTRRCAQLSMFFDTRSYVKTCDPASAGAVERLRLCARMSEMCSAYVLLCAGVDPRRAAGDGLSAIEHTGAACVASCGPFSLECGHQAMKAMLVTFSKEHLHKGSPLREVPMSWMEQPSAEQWDILREDVEELKAALKAEKKRPRRQGMKLSGDLKVSGCGRAQRSC